MSTPDNNLPQADYDVVIIGGAAAGLTAALYASRRAMRTLVLTKSLGGQAAMTPSIENYPGTKQIGGIELMQNFLAHAQEYGASIAYETVQKVEKNGDVFTVTSNAKSYTALTVILAFGLTPRNLEVPGELEYQGKGVTYCATCDAPLYKKKTVAVVGGTFEALDAALFLAKLEANVTLIHDKSGYPAYKKLFAEAEASSNITVRLNTRVTKVVGELVVSGIGLQAVGDDSAAEELLPVQGVFVEKGHKIDSQWLGEMVEFTKGNAVVVDELKSTKTPGLFAAGDLTPQRDKQVVVSAGAGATAALSAYTHIQKLSGKPTLLVDWEHTEDL
ncbi:MAG: thioredoxin reductase [Candidatus Kerfeldbacteria bacterium CG15_BIG_FIL_POST_REV_8_21_14_020_45_12]|uniref:Thioredoxin reductase n=1 Tax=Candidatus Kerfeldbacteria bacterium CG15_BIG_FIL_POST_REV_8_21_14_020_45_12 TaxID=2014247 RepID=A0A2M7H2P8_9BACT|nr:MAG: thioredoxin reductase [Candidatus Kerfeldbacteria bacterium CG15_BIG_FIL_POST_REV_8_21_14_020_45_12]PJA93253.1 MAG: thioredoxin reductase [Candidatus Kerfeldbacteria bacterium CG_4_9_14_3_um_filter_45_8]